MQQPNESNHAAHIARFLLRILTVLCFAPRRSRKREHLHSLQVRLTYLEKENERLTQKLAQQDADLQHFKQHLPHLNAGKHVCPPQVLSTLLM